MSLHLHTNEVNNNTNIKLLKKIILKILMNIIII